MGEGCPEEGGNDRGHRGQIIQTILHIGFKIGLCAGRLLSTGIAFDVAVEQFVRVVLRRIGREVEKLNSILMLLQPGHDLLRVVDTKVVKDQEDFLLAVRDQTGHEIDQLIRVHAVLVQHKSQLSTLGNGRQHLDLQLLGFNSDHGRLPLRRVAARIVGRVLDIGFIPEKDLRVLFLGSLCDPGELMVQPFIDLLFVLLVGSL